MSVKRKALGQIVLAVSGRGVPAELIIHAFVVTGALLVLTSLLRASSYERPVLCHSAVHP